MRSRVQNLLYMGHDDARLGSRAFMLLAFTSVRRWSLKRPRWMNVIMHDCACRTGDYSTGVIESATTCLSSMSTPLVPVAPIRTSRWPFLAFPRRCCRKNAARVVTDPSPRALRVCRSGPSFLDNLVPTVALPVEWYRSLVIGGGWLGQEVHNEAKHGLGDGGNR